MTLQEVKDAVDAKLATLWSAVQSKEDAYFAANGRYWQGLRTASVIPADGNEVLPDIGTAVPSYQGSPWPLAIRNTALPMALEITQYQGPLGAGYQATVSVTVLGNLYQRTAQVGPEVYRTEGWHQVTP